MIKLGTTTKLALAARPRWINRNTLTWRDLVDAFAHRLDNASNLVSENHRLADAHGAEATILVVMQIGAANAACGDIHQHFTGAGLQRLVLLDP